MIVVESTDRRRQAEDRARRSHLQEGQNRDKVTIRPEGYTQTKDLQAKAYLVGIWCKEGLEALEALKGDERARALRAFRQAEGRYGVAIAQSPRALLACVKAAFAAAACAEPAKPLETNVTR